MNNWNSYMDPGWGVNEWEADMHCEACGKDAVHEFNSGPFAVTQAVCTECDEVTDVELPDGEDF